MRPPREKGERWKEALGAAVKGGWTRVSFTTAGKKFVRPIGTSPPIRVQKAAASSRGYRPSLLRGPHAARAASLARVAAGPLVAAQANRAPSWPTRGEPGRLAARSRRQGDRRADGPPPRGWPLIALSASRSHPLATAAAGRPSLGRVGRQAARWALGEASERRNASRAKDARERGWCTAAGARARKRTARPSPGAGRPVS